MARETIENLFLFINRKRWCRFRVERTKAEPVFTRLMQLHFLTNNIQDINLWSNLIDQLWWNSHFDLSSLKKGKKHPLFTVK